MSAVLRTWTFWIFDWQHEDCIRDLEALVFPRMRQAPGNRRATALFQLVEDGTLKVDVLSAWDSLDAVKAFAGPDYLKPTIPPSHWHKPVDREPTVRHYALDELPENLRGVLS